MKSSETAEKNSAQTNRQTDRHYENNGHLAVNQKHKKNDIVQKKRPGLDVYATNVINLIYAKRNSTSPRDNLTV